MRRFIVAALLCAAGSSFAQDSMVARFGSDSVRIYPVACKSKVILGNAPAELREALGRAVAWISGKSYEACWTAAMGGVVLFYEDGDQGMVPAQEFKEDNGI